MDKTGIQQLQELNKKKKKLNTLDKYLIFCFTVILIYTIAHTVIFAITGQEATTLTISVFACFSGEMVMCLLIKKFKLHDEFKIIKGKKNEFDGSIDDM